MLAQRANVLERVGDVCLAGLDLLQPRLTARPGAFETWMRRRGKLGGQNKVPRVDNSGTLTRELVEFLRESGQAGAAVTADAATYAEPATR